MRPTNSLLRGDCLQALYGFVWHRDQLEADKAVSFLSSNGIWERGGKEFRGVEAVRGAIASAPRGGVLRHVISNEIIRAESETEARGSAYFTVYGEPRAMTMPELPIAISGPVWVGEYDLAFIKEDGLVWRLALLRSRRIFAGPGARS
ncbi:nuclear transport factor 2 family protein [Ensifer sp. ENS05]|uniref:nuclear transport factor 2 family protein n=1 Tax=Ensifer sp. ENS05 TaxID=2769277 RepID=UPI00178408F5|nr:nuclear transport factor 2 family protein [Ensifer sp. ENS05]MBD9597299.1 nuclear transport factor 2 family protein [Ensifer sp. ENS05]